jgi:Zn-dependent M28 family amino/carboxypeptidase
VNDAAIVGHLPEAADQFTSLRASPAMVVQPSEWMAAVIARMGRPREVGAPNVAGILEGSDPTLRREYIVISAHMDHVGSRCGGVSAADAICNGADDDASGTAGVVELAEALSQPGARPRRSVIFLTVSAEERGLWGSRIFAASPPVDIKSIVANLNMDMIGRNWPDTIVAIGKSHSDLGLTVDEVAAAHPELGMNVVDDLWPAENLYRRSDHFNFARRGVPVLFFTSGLHEDYHAVTDSPEKIDAEKESRILRLVFHLTQEIGNRTARPKWKKESYDAVVGR